MIKLYFSLKIFIPLVMILGFILFVITSLIKEKIDSMLKKNCYDCKHYILYDVDKYGSGCTFKCKLKNKCYHKDMNDNTNYVKCKEFKSINNNIQK